MPKVCSRLEPDPFGLRAAAGTRTTVRQRRQRVFVVASVLKLHPQRLQVMVITAPIIAPICAIKRNLNRRMSTVVVVKPLTMAEEQAARIVAAVGDCLCEQLDPGGGPTQLPDFVLKDSRRARIGVLEVTSTVVGELAAFRSAQAKYKISDPRLRFDWFLVSRDPSTNLKALQKTLSTLLHQAEQKGFVPTVCDVLEPGFNFIQGEEPQTSLYQQGIFMLSVLPAVQGMPGHIYVKPPAQGGGIGPEMVTQAVQIELERDDNLAKLRMASRGERSELFVWLDEATAGMALVTPRLFPQQESAYPKKGPTLPVPVTRVWAATGPNDRDVLARALWVAEGGNWQVLTAPPRLT